MTGNEAARILHADAALDGRLGQIAELTDDAEDRTGARGEASELVKGSEE